MNFNFYSKPYISEGGFKARMWRCFSIVWHSKSDNKRFGYWNIYYDGYFHFFGLGIITLSWCHRPDMGYIKDNNIKTK